MQHTRKCSYAIYKQQEPSLVCVSLETVSLVFFLSIRQYEVTLYAGNEGPDQPVRKHSLIRAFIARL